MRAPRGGKSQQLLIHNLTLEWLNYPISLKNPNPGMIRQFHKGYKHKFAFF
jgi:hypothetical protein